MAVLKRACHMPLISLTVHLPLHSIMIPPKNVEEKGEGRQIAEDWDEMQECCPVCVVQNLAWY